ncbi:ABC transporter ATP-binding protein [Novosphingobium sp. KACC 22771]|uniref:ABC transporter ATP-binding protein n=1 Tax=Novosphingobium sp. KACC 22771 TaxID=3025670 RepID=UPI002365F25C|nr:ATP-binding cassette domain-containing protein [Novosphingobium sp. KACC 22771]WDF73226.1 ATP-binding cassette domain-containing protein [Novosphingobium sp. KACC 22771]
MTTTAKIAWTGITKRFGAQVVLDGLDLAVAPGRSLALLGRSGQGKSVTIKLALGLMKPDAGQVLLDGVDVTRQSEAERRANFRGIGMLFQGGALFDSLPVWENVAFRLINADGVGRAEARERAVEALSLVKLAPEVADRYPSELSGGMQKRAGLARAIVGTPSLLFFDEPTTGLDPITAGAINELIRDRVTSLGCTAVSITHDMASARTIADELAMLDNGRIVWRGLPGELDDADHPLVRAFVSGKSME